MEKKEDTAAFPSGGSDDDAALAISAPTSVKQHPADGMERAPPPLQLLVKEHVRAAKEHHPPLPGKQQHSKEAPIHVEMQQLSVGGTGAQSKAECLGEKVETEEAKMTTVVEDPSKLAVKRTNIAKLESFQTVKVCGWVQKLSRQDKIMRITLRDGSGLLQCVLSDLLCETSEALALSEECSVELFGIVRPVPEALDHQLIVEFFKVVGRAPPGGLKSVVDENSAPDVQLDNRHLMIRHVKVTNVLRVRSVIDAAFRQHYVHHDYYLVQPPSIVQMPIEGGANHFELNYFGEPAFMTRSGQEHLETAIASLGDVYHIGKSFQSEPSSQFSETTKVEVECPNISFNDLLNRLEDVVVDVSERVMDSPLANIVLELNPGFKVPEKPFLRKTYAEAIVYLKANGITKDDGSFFEFGEDIPEEPKRMMADKMNEPIFLCSFPAEIKPFYVKKRPEDLQLTESVELLMPGVGKLASGSTRIENLQELIEAIKKAGIDPAHPYWYIDQRRFGSCPHGGYALGLEHFMKWMLKLDDLIEACLYPRSFKRNSP